MTEPICTPVRLENVLGLLRRLEDETKVRWMSGNKPLVPISRRVKYICFHDKSLLWNDVKTKRYQIVTWNQFVQIVKETVGER